MQLPDSDPPVDELLAAAYALDGPASSRALYARWADTYETGFIVDSGYIYHQQVAAVFAQRSADLADDDVVVDVGCGTGLAGAALRTLAPVAVDGLDISPEMLEQASRKSHDRRPVYRRLLPVDLTQRIEIPDHTYAGAVSVGTFTHGHVGPAALDELVRIVRPGGLMAIGINAAHFATAGFGPALDALAAAGRITTAGLVDVPIYEGADMDDPDQFAHIAVFAVR